MMLAFLDPGSIRGRAQHILKAKLKTRKMKSIYFTAKTHTAELCPAIIFWGVAKNPSLSLPPVSTASFDEWSGTLLLPKVPFQTKIGHISTNGRQAVS